MLALAAHANNVPVYSVFPFSTVDIELESGDLIPIEERPQDEVLDLKLHDRLVTPKDASARNPAFDVTPHELITAFITEKGVIYPPFEDTLIDKTRGL
jgi:methylthioribose-1-phosphate isomerase